MSATSERRVHHLRLRSPAAGLAARAQFQIEDALRTASLRDYPRELLLVRRLDLGRIRVDAPPGEITRRLEQRWAETESLAVAAGPTALPPDASAVRFPSLHAALAAFARAVSHGVVPQAWLWRLVIASGSTTPLASMGLREAASAVLSRAAQAESYSGEPAFARVGQSIAAVSALLSELQDTGDLEPFAALLHPAVVRDLLFQWGCPVRDSACAAQPSPPARAGGIEPSPPALRPDVALSASAVASIRALILRLAPQDPRVHLAAIACLCVDQPWRASQVSRLAIDAAALIHSLIRAPASAPPANAATDIAALRRAPLPETGVTPDPSPAVEDTVRAAPSDGSHADLVSARESPWTATLCGGLYFMAVALGRLDMTKRGVDPSLAVRVLLRLAGWAGADARDSVVAPLLSLHLPPADERELALWTLAVRRYLRRRWRLRWMKVVARPGRIAWTRTHLDIAFDLRQADPQIRRAGLDIDPGWTPWLGRVVSFHYGDVR